MTTSAESLISMLSLDKAGKKTDTIYENFRLFLEYAEVGSYIWVSFLNGSSIHGPLKTAYVVGDTSAKGETMVDTGIGAVDLQRFAFRHEVESAVMDTPAGYVVYNRRIPLHKRIYSYLEDCSGDSGVLYWDGQTAKDIAKMAEEYLRS